MKYPNRLQAAILLDDRFEGLDEVARDFARIFEMKFGETFKVPEQTPGTFLRLFGGGEDLMLTFEYRENALDPQAFSGALTSAVTTILAPDMHERVARARSHILLEVSHGAIGGIEGDPKVAEMMAELGMEHPGASAETFGKRLETLAMMTRVVSDHITPSAIHWTQSDQLFDAAQFETLVAGGFPGPITIHPLLFGEQEASGQNARIGLRTFGAQHWLGREILVRPTVLPWAASYQAVLAFCAAATMDGGYIIPDGDTFGPQAEDGTDGGEVWRVNHVEASDAADDLPEGVEAQVPLYKLTPLRSDAHDFLVDEYIRSAQITRTRVMQSKPSDMSDDTDQLGEGPDGIDNGQAESQDDGPSDMVSEMSAAIAEGKAEAAASFDQSASANFAPVTPSAPGEPSVSGRGLRQRVFGSKGV